MHFCCSNIKLLNLNLKLHFVLYKEVNVTSMCFFVDDKIHLLIALLIEIFLFLESCEYMAPLARKERFKIIQYHWKPFWPMEYSTNTCLCGNHTLPNKVYHSGLWRMRPHEECFPGSDGASSWKMWIFWMDMRFCFYPMTFKKLQGSHVEIAHLCTPLFCMNCVLVMG